MSQSGHSAVLSAREGHQVCCELLVWCILLGVCVIMPSLYSINLSLSSTTTVHHSLTVFHYYVHPCHATSYYSTPPQCVVTPPLSAFTPLPSAITSSHSLSYCHQSSLTHITSLCVSSQLLPLPWPVSYILTYLPCLLALQQTTRVTVAQKRLRMRRVPSCKLRGRCWAGAHGCPRGLWISSA